MYIINIKSYINGIFTYVRVGKINLYVRAVRAGIAMY